MFHVFNKKVNVDYNKKKNSNIIIILIITVIIDDDIKFDLRKSNEGILKYDAFMDIIDEHVQSKTLIDN